MKRIRIGFVCITMLLSICGHSLKAQESMLGEIKLIAGTFAPKGWAFCDGRILLISNNTALYSVIGYTYGGVEGISFALPDLRGRVPMETGTGTALNSIKPGEKQGTDILVLEEKNLPIHSHSITGASPPLTEVDEKSKMVPMIVMVSASVAKTVNTSSARGGIGIDNRQPTITMNYIICINGTYPHRK
jgi:microcystin-dependent protein